MIYNNTWIRIVLVYNTITFLLKVYGGGVHYHIYTVFNLTNLIYMAARTTHTIHG